MCIIAKGFIRDSDDIFPKCFKIESIEQLQTAATGRVKVSTFQTVI